MIPVREVNDLVYVAFPSIQCEDHLHDQWGVISGQDGCGPIHDRLLRELVLRLASLVRRSLKIVYIAVGNPRLHYF